MKNCKEKWRIIKQVLKNENSILITNHGDSFGFDYTGDNPTFGRLFQHIVHQTYSWYKDLQKGNSDEGAISKMDLFMQGTQK